MKTRGSLGLRNTAFECRARPFVTAGILNETDLLTLDLVAPRFGEEDPDVLLGLAFAVRAPRAGHVGVDLSAIAEHIDDEVLSWAGRGDDEPVVWPSDPRAWADRTLGSPLVASVPGPVRPFVHERYPDGRQILSTRRQWDEQERTAKALWTLATTTPGHPLGDAALESGIAALFGADVHGEAASAVRTAASRRLTVITGGPGTGKTYSIKRLLALLLTALAPEAASSARGAPFRVALAAPTGKAAARMAAAMGEDADSLAAPEPVKAALRALLPRTLHKLLGVRPDGTTRHDRSRPLPFELIVVDEASMIDLALMRRLVEAVPEGARLVLLGDRDQLASVEAGSVLADLVGGSAPSERAHSTPLDGGVVRFTRSRRFEDAPGIGAVAAAIARGDDASLRSAVSLLQGVDVAPGETLPGRLRALGMAPGGLPTSEQLAALAAPYFDIGYAGILEAALTTAGPGALIGPGLVARVLEALDRYRVLAVHRRGVLGVSGLSRALEERLEGRLRHAARSDVRPSGPFWPGRLVLVSVNAYDVGLMNGDVGVILPSLQGSGLDGVFPPLDGRPGSPPRRVAVSRLPPHDGALVMTVHKSQGSQFEHVGLVLAGRESPIETRELIYTGVTRARARLTWLGSPGELARALRRQVLRTSGLAERLRVLSSPSSLCARGA